MRELPMEEEMMRDYYIKKASGYTEETEKEKLKEVKIISATQFLKNNMDINNPDHPLHESKKGTPNYEKLVKALPTEELSFGEQLVGIKFHPANDDKVGQIKTKMAEIANLINDTEGNGYLFNLVKGHALRSILDAQMTSVKLVTLKY